ncbi:hypothetical protein TeGR_g10905 [Tetraparma gracilis]|uniref:Uncharacterized protein n=1 Tax=Tetraparma gracilis TaxID=2962635 RepID=A0ABQ6MD31_9STRA|nr:hypothetical protein TeGR_g10905 [Tetraparma gracilis]
MALMSRNTELDLQLLHYGDLNSSLIATLRQELSTLHIVTPTPSATSDGKAVAWNASTREGVAETGDAVPVKIGGKLSGVQKRHKDKKGNLVRTESAEVEADQNEEGSSDEEDGGEGEDRFSADTFGSSSIGMFGERQTSVHGRDRNSRTLWQSDSGGVGLVKETPTSIQITLDESVVKVAQTSFSSILRMVQESQANQAQREREEQANRAQRLAFEAKERARMEREAMETQREQLLFDGLGFGSGSERGVNDGSRRGR